MLRHHVQKSAAAAKRYYEATAADYYSTGMDIRPVFGGKGAERLGIAGPADKKHFDRLCDNLHPITGEPLTQRQRQDRIVGIDYTLDGPKGAAVLEAFAPEEERRRLAEARRLSELETLAEMEERMATRVRTGRREENRTTGNMLWFGVPHDTTRPVDGIPDMHPHTHYFVLNATWDEAEQRWKAANQFDIIRDLPYFQQAFQQRHAMRLQAMGYEVERKGKFFEVAGIPKSVIDKYSRRTKLIEKRAKELGITDPDRKGELGAQTREHKAAHFTPDQLRRIWLSWLTDAERIDVTETMFAALRNREEGLQPARPVTAREALAFAAAHVFERKSSAPATELLAKALEYGVGGFTVEQAWNELEKDGRFTATVDGRLTVAHRDVLAEEQGMVRLAANGRHTLAPLNAAHSIKNTKLNIPQRAAVHHLLGSRDAVTTVVGAAGVGKTTLLKEAERGANAAGVRVLAFAPTAAASRITMREGDDPFPDAETVQALLTRKDLQAKARGQVILVDEAALLGTREAAKLLALAKELNARLWLVGDDLQHRAVTRGSPFALLRTHAGITPATVTEVQRQSGPYKALAELARKDPAAAFERMRQMEWVKEVDDAERYKLLAADYIDATAPERRKRGGTWQDVSPTALVIAPTHAEGAKVTAEIREQLKAAGRLGEERELLRLVNRNLTEAERADPHSYEPGDILQFTQNAKGYTRGGRVELSEGVPPPAHLAARFQAYRPGTLRVAVGDRLRVTAGGTARGGQRLDTGDTFTVLGFTKSGDLLDDRGRLIPADYGHLAHGYVTTSVSAQSRTVDRVLIAMGQESRGAIGREQFYTSLTRGRQWARVYTDDAQGLAHAVQRQEQTVSATELAARRAAEGRLRQRLTVQALARRRRAFMNDHTRPVDTTRPVEVRREHAHAR